MAESFRGVVIPGEDNSLSAADLADAARRVGLDAHEATDITAALVEIRAKGDGPKRVLICGSLYLAGSVLAGNLEAVDGVRMP